MRPARRRPGSGDGDLCPLADHGRMNVSRDHRIQYCPDQTHDGVWTEHGKQPPTRSFWPFQHFEAAVAAYTETHDPVKLPELGDISL